MAGDSFYKNIKMINWYPPYIGAGIKLKKVNEDKTRMEVELRKTWFNKNLFGTHFGGSLYAMCDPFYVFIVHNYLGKGYVVWDKSAEIEFIKPGNGKVKALFEISQEKLLELKEKVDHIGKHTVFFETAITNEDQEIVAKVRKEIYMRKKP
jgi:acyl-coenzyme A thioesterase PaaI-like protein